MTVPSQYRPPAERGSWRRSPAAVLVVAVLGTAMAFVDATIVNISVPSIAAQFPTARLSSVSWVLNGYNVVFAAFLIGGGQLADKLGRRRVFMLALAVFTAASALCALAPTLDMLVLARVLQAGGAALLIPSSLAIVLHAHPAERRVRAITLWAAAAAAAAGVGPPLGGLLISASGWRLVFLVNVPIGLLTLALARAIVPESRRPGTRRPDLLGEAALSLAVATLVLAIVKAEEWGWLSVPVLATMLASVLLGATFWARCRRDPGRLVDPALFRVRSFNLANGATLVMAAGFYGYTLCNVLFLTGVWHYSILQAGLAMVPGPLVAMAVAAAASRPIEHFGHRAVIVPGAIIWASGLAYLATMLGSRPDFLGQFLPAAVVLGLGVGLTFPAVSGGAVMSVPGDRYALASALNAVARQVGAALGVAAMVAILGQTAVGGSLASFRHGWLFAAACLLAGAGICLRLVVRPATPPPRASEAASRIDTTGGLPRKVDSKTAHFPLATDSG
ncbi:MAG TPA: DHA2 family efflux MFS transporter permease subunit [Solirubrobacteraceae bacterium]|nr:DHA2 family efflux MFS transporter permease subunit [Solirubrobacteraceae bacterium]